MDTIEFAEDVIEQHGDPDMGFDELVELLIQNGCSDEFAQDVAADISGM